LGSGTRIPFNKGKGLRDGKTGDARRGSDEKCESDATKQGGLPKKVKRSRKRTPDV